MKIGTVLISAACAAIAGCAAPQAGEGETYVKAGPAPTKDQAAAAIRSYLNHYLKDPDSVKQFAIRSGPDHATWYRGLLNGGGHEAAWLTCFEYNAKNSYGAYVGLKTDGFMMRMSGDVAEIVTWVNWAAASRRCW